MRTLSKDQFTEELWKLNTAGDQGNTYSYLLRTFIEKEVYTFDNSLVTFELIVDKYKKYISWWNQSFADVDPAFMKKANEKISISTFLLKSMYQQEFSTPKKKRDYYLFGEYTHNQLLDKVKTFNTQFQIHAKQEPTPLF